MVKSLKTIKTLWLTITCLSLVAAFFGIFNQNVYGKVVSRDLLPGLIAQDAITIIACLVLLFLSLKTNGLSQLFCKTIRFFDRCIQSTALFFEELLRLMASLPFALKTTR